MRYVAVASAEFARQRLPQGLTRKNFNQLPYLSFNRKDDMQAEFVARCLGLRNVSLQHQIPAAQLRGTGAPYVPAGALACCRSCWCSPRWMPVS
jgi:hypothetical protein